MTLLSRADLPITQLTHDALDLEKYARALAAFIQRCETPMTVGIQGEWGSGKTSLMKMVREVIKGTQTGPKEPPWMFEFGTWQYGAVGDDALLGAHLLSSFTQSITDAHAENGIISKMGSGVRALVRFLGKSIAAGAVNAASGTLVDGGTLFGDTGSDMTPSVDLGSLKRDFERLVNKVVESASSKQKASARFILFIDDLDRVRPECAIALLEVLKNFMDVPHCVFVVACDYEVVRQGVRRRFGIEEDKKARAFFDKIIQVPFQMPVSRYKLNSLLTRFFEQKFKGKGADTRAAKRADELAALVAIATGTNPRALKRFLNSLDLHASLSEQDTATNEKAHVWSADGSTRALVGLVALQSRWPAVAAYLSDLDEPGLVSALSALASELASEEEAPSEDLETSVADDAGVDRDQWPTSSDVSDLFKFATRLLAVLDSDRDGKLSEADVADLHKWSKELALTQVLRSPTSKSPWSEFEVNIASQPSRSLMLRLANAIWELRAQGLSIQRTADKFTVQVSAQTVLGRKTITVLVISADGTLSHNLGDAVASKYQLAAFTSVGEELHSATTKIGVNWTNSGKTSRWTDLNKVSEKAVTGLEAEVLNAVRQIIAATRRLNERAAETLDDDIG